MFKIAPSDTMNSAPCALDIIGNPSLVQVYEIDVGLALACIATCNASPSIPTTVYDGGGRNFGGSIQKIKYISINTLNFDEKENNNNKLRI